MTVIAGPESGEAAETVAELTLYRKEDGGLLSKRIRLGDNGPVSDGSPCRMSFGICRRRPVTDLDDLATVIEGMQSNEAISLGTLLGDRAEAEIVLKGQETNGKIARTLDHIGFPHGRPGCMLIDFDPKGMPDAKRQALRAVGGILKVLAAVAPNLAKGGLLTRPSTSAGLYNAETGERYHGSNGMHIYVLVADAADIPRAVKDLHWRMWLDGYGWIVIGAAGQLLVRSPVDPSVGSPERLVFEGPPELETPLAQDQRIREATICDGPIVDTREAIPLLSALEADRVENLIVNAKAAIHPEADKVRAASDRRVAGKIAERDGIPIEEALPIVRQRHRGHLLPAMSLEFDDLMLRNTDGRLTTVADVLAAPARFIGQTLADPLEGMAYGRGKAKVMGPPDDSRGVLFIHSFAHGGGSYWLRYDGAMARAHFDAAMDNDALDVLLQLIPISDLRHDELQAMKDAAASRAKISKSAVNKMVVEAVRRAARQGKAAPRDRPDFEERRPLVIRPAKDAELTPTLVSLDDALLTAVRDAHARRTVPPFRNLEGKLATIVERPVSKLHTLLSSKERQARLAAGKELPPAPPLPLLTPLHGLDAAVEIERFARFADIFHDEDGRQKTRNVAMPPRFTDAYAEWPASELPVVSAVATLPIVLPDGSIAMTNGYDAKLGIIFKIPQPVFGVVPSNVTLAEAREAWRYLTEDWLVDVPTDAPGMANAVALVLTIIERAILPGRPMFPIVANQAGSGKTTLANMIARATTGKDAPAASWSEVAEEQRKAIYAHFIQSPPLLVFDNIDEGAKLHSPVLEAAATAAEISDRTLGLSVIGTVPATTVIAFTGNLYSMVKDSAYRVLPIHLDARTAEPWTREFRHADPLDFTDSHRLELLRAAYTILRAPATSREADLAIIAAENVGKSEAALAEADPQVSAAKRDTRFKAFNALIGHKVTAVSGQGLGAAVGKAIAADDHRQGLVDLVGFLIAEYPKDIAAEAQAESAPFLARHITEIINFRPETSPEIGTKRGSNAADGAKLAKGDALREMFLAMAGKGLPPGQVDAAVVGLRLRMMCDKPVRLANGAEVALQKLAKDPDANVNQFSVQLISGRNGGR